MLIKKKIIHSIEVFIQCWAIFVTIYKGMKLAIQKMMKKWEKQMIGPIEKGFQAAQVQAPPKTTYQGIDLSILPKYICFRAALLKEKSNIQFMLLVVVVLFGVHYLASRSEISTLVTKLREKEYILAPGVLDFTTASPQSVPDHYIDNAVTSFALDLGNINYTNIEEQYRILEDYMSDQVKVQFQIEYADWISQVKDENISQIFAITDKEVISNNQGNYKAVVFGRAEFYSNGQYLGHEDQVIEMELRLVPPKSGKRWYLEMSSLNWNKVESFTTKTNLTKPSPKK